MLLTGASFVQALADFRQDCVYEAFQGANKDRGRDAMSSLQHLFDDAKGTAASPAKSSPVKRKGSTAFPTTIDIHGSVVDS